MGLQPCQLYSKGPCTPGLSSTRLALVTGAIKGLVLPSCGCWWFPGDVVLTAWDEVLGRTAVRQVQAKGLSPRFHQLDITDLQSICALCDFLHKEYRGLNVLVNNVGIAFKSKWVGSGSGGVGGGYSHCERSQAGRGRARLLPEPPLWDLEPLP